MARKKYAPYTYVDEKLLAAGRSVERREFVASNCEKLADFLEQEVPPKYHDQSAWSYNAHKGDCQTVGCALGWAAMSGIFPGLQYAQPDPYNIIPIVNAKVSYFDLLGTYFFGASAYDVFYNISLSHSDTISRLRDLAHEYRESSYA